eukprot:scaffold26_cov173-Pinguiococcus_pyrenoidosus.AAC.2
MSKPSPISVTAVLAGKPDDGFSDLLARYDDLEERIRDSNEEKVADQLLQELSENPSAFAEDAARPRLLRRMAQTILEIRERQDALDETDFREKMAHLTPADVQLATDKRLEEGVQRLQNMEDQLNRTVARLEAKMQEQEDRHQEDLRWIQLELAFRRLHSQLHEEASMYVPRCLKTLSSQGHMKLQSFVPHHGWDFDANHVREVGHPALVMPKPAGSEVIHFCWDNVLGWNALMMPQMKQRYLAVLEQQTGKAMQNTSLHNPVFVDLVEFEGPVSDKFDELFDNPSAQTLSAWTWSTKNFSWQPHPTPIRDFIFLEADLSGWCFDGADLHEVPLTGSTANEETSFRNANLCEVDATEVKWSGVVLEGANLRRAVLKGADLKNANMRGADLSGANLQGVNLDGADLRNADLSGTLLNEAVGEWMTGSLLWGLTTVPCIQRVNLISPSRAPLHPPASPPALPSALPAAPEATGCVCDVIEGS